ncbi:MAG: hypothetical protein R3D05_09005 [Dongiaceae bacterium]
MDIAALGAAATQLSGAQRQQQASLSGIKSAQVQAQSLISILTAATSQAPQTQAAAQPVNATTDASDGSTADRRLPRGSIVNILA